MDTIFWLRLPLFKKQQQPLNIKIAQIVAHFLEGSHFSFADAKTESSFAVAKSTLQRQTKLFPLSAVTNSLLQKCRRSVCAPRVVAESHVCLKKFNSDVSGHLLNSTRLHLHLQTWLCTDKIRFRATAAKKWFYGRFCRCNTTSCFWHCLLSSDFAATTLDL